MIGSVAMDEEDSPPMLRKARAALAPVLVALAALAGLAGCGESGAKRAADAQTEALRFYAVDAPVVALLGAEPPHRIAELDLAAGGLPAWTRLRAALLEPLGAAGIGERQLARLVRPREEVEGVETAALAIGAPAPAYLQGGRALVVLVTDQAELLARLLRQAALRGPLRPAGELDEASFYRGPGRAFAVRDGVLVSASRLADVRIAIERRDGDSDAQLDEDVVGTALDELQNQEALLVYADLDSMRQIDRGLRRLAERSPWTGSVGEIAASAYPEGRGLGIEVVARATHGELATQELPLGATPRRFEISPASAAALVPAGPARRLVSVLAPLQGEATASSEQVRAQALLAP